MPRLVPAALVAFLVLCAGASSADTFDVHLVSQTSSRITLGWTPQPGFGYLFSSAGVLRSRTNDPSRSSVRFAKVSPASYDVDVMTKGNSGRYQPGVVPPPPTASVTQTIVNGSTIPNITGWRAVYDANGDGVEDDPGKIEFYIDNVFVLSEINAPFGDTFATGTPSTVAGSHAFMVRALTDTGVLLATNTVVATVGSPPPPPSGCALPNFPDASCTGVPAGTTLTPSGGLTINIAGTVVNGLDISGPVVVNAPNVTIRNSRITTNAMFAVDNNSTGLLVEDTTIRNQPVSGQPNCHVGVGSANFTVLRTNISGCENGIDGSPAGNITLTDSYIHDLDTVGPSWVFGTSGPHTDGIQISQSTNVIIRHNTIVPVGAVVGGGATSGIIMYTPLTGAPNTNTWIEDNLIDGRNASVGIYAVRQQTHDMYINRNRMYKGVFGQYTFCVKVGITVTTFDDNRDAGTGALIAPDNGVGGGCTN